MYKRVALEVEIADSDRAEMLTNLQSSVSDVMQTLQSVCPPPHDPTSSAIIPHHLQSLVSELTRQYPGQNIHPNTVAQIMGLPQQQKYPS